jgi:hypothetical protein
VILCACVALVRRVVCACVSRLFRAALSLIMAASIAHCKTCSAVQAATLVGCTFLLLRWYVLFFNAQHSTALCRAQKRGIRYDSRVWHATAAAACTALLLRYAAAAIALQGGQAIALQHTSVHQPLDMLEPAAGLHPFVRMTVQSLV